MDDSRGTSTPAQDRSAAVKDKFVAAGKVSATSVRLRATDGTADVSIGIASPRQQKALPTELRTVPGSASPGAGAISLTSRRSSVHSSVSSISAKSKSVLSGEGERQPILEGNIQLQGGFECGDKVISALHTPDSNALIGGLMNGSIKVFNTATGALNGTLENEESINEAMPISRIRCKPSGDVPILAATYVSGHLRIWNYTNGQCVGQVQDENKDIEYLCLSYNPFADVIAVGLDNGHIKLFDEKTLQITSLLKKSLSSSKVDGHTDRVFCIANHPLNPHEFVSSGWDNTLQVWDVRAPHAVRSIYGVFVCGEGLAFDRRGKELMVAHWRPWRNLQFLDYSNGNVINEVEADPQNPHYLTCAQYIGKDHVAIGGTDRSLVKIIDKHTLTTLASIKDIGAIYDLDVNTKAQLTGNRIVVATRTNILNIDFNK